MIRISFFIFFINFCFSQKLVGVVTTIADEPIFGATVYIDGSTIGTTTNDKGEFELNLPNSQVVNSSLVFSHVAFESVYLNQFDISRRYRIKLIEKVNNLSEVTALNSIFSRAQMMDVFKKQFIGKTTASKSCKIENENEIYFYDVTRERSNKIKLAENFVDNFFFKDGILAIFTQNKITNYKLILP